MTVLSDFFGIHEGETCLLVGNGLSLNDLPLDFLSAYPSIGANTIHLKEGFTPTYYTAVDSRVMFEFGDAVNEHLAHIPKFIPTPNLDKWQGENFYRFYHRPGALWPYGNGPLWPRSFLSEEGITYSCVMHIMMQLAYFMGFARMLAVGMDHTLDKKIHFWGVDDGMPNGWPKEQNAEGYRELREGFAPKAEILNISTYTELPEDILPRGDWRDWTKETICKS